MNHIFLTGEIKIGKSTVINKTLALLNIHYGGFRTYFGTDRSNPDRCLYINEASQALKFDPRQVIARFCSALPPEVCTDVFNNYGAYCLRRARNEASLIIMDECGSFESNADIFLNEILRTLDGDIPVLGVVKLSASGWVDHIRNHPKVILMTVDTGNRDLLPGLLSNSLQHR